MRRTIDFCVNHNKFCTIFFIFITLFFAWHAKSVKIDSDLKNVLPKDENASSVELDSYLFVGFRAKEGGELFTLDSLNALSEVITNLENLPEINQSISIFNTNSVVIGSSGRIVSGTKLPGGRIPKTENELKEFSESVLNDPFFENLLVCDDGTYIITAFLTEGASDNNAFFNEELERLVAPLKEYVDVSIAGDLPLVNRAEYYLTRDFSTLLVAALIVMLVILFISFRARRALLLPVMVVIMGVIWTVGFISLVGFKLSVVTCVVPALVLTIGSSYTIHVLNEFFRNGPTVSTGDKKWITEAIRHVNKTILMASLTTIIGFMSLLGGSQQVIKQFALSVSFGVASTAILSLFLLPAIFSMLKDPSKLHLKVTNKGYLTLLLGRLGHQIVRLRYILVLIGLVIGLSTFYFIPRLTVGSDYYTYFPQDDTVIQELMYVTRMGGGTTWINLTLEAPDGTDGYFGTYEGLQLQSKIEEDIKTNNYVFDVISMVSYLKKMNEVRFGTYEIPERKGLIVLLKRSFSTMFSTSQGMFKEAKLVEDDYNKVTMMIRVYDKKRGAPLTENDFPEFLESINKSISFAIDEGINTHLWGNGYVANTVSRILLKDQVFTLILSFFLVFLAACIYFKSFYYGFVTIIPLITAICTNYIFMVVLNIPLDITTIMVSSVAIGVGVDDAIHFLIQYRMQLEKYPNDIEKVLHLTFKITGRPIVLTTVSIVAGMLVLVLASFVPIGYFGILVSLALVGALIGTLVFLPAVLVVVFYIKKRFMLFLSSRSNN